MTFWQSFTCSGIFYLTLWNYGTDNHFWEERSRVQHCAPCYSNMCEWTDKISAESHPQLVWQFNLKLNPSGLLLAPNPHQEEVAVHISAHWVNPWKTATCRSQRHCYYFMETILVAISLRGSDQDIAKCVRCRGYVGEPFRLPPSPDFRETKMKPFATVGIDFTGHLTVKNSSKTKKCYICLFTRSTTRYVHLEIVTDMSTDQFLQAFRCHFAVYGTLSVRLCLH